MKRLAILVCLLAFLAAPAPAAAHPLGNFTVNQFSLVEASGDRIYVTYVLDLAEIPTFQARAERERKGEDVYARDLAETIRAGLSVSVAGEPLALRERSRRIELLPGAGGLETTRLELVLETSAIPEAGGPLVYRDRSFADRIGWKEVVLAARDGASLTHATAPAESVSDRLRAYPDGLLDSPLDVREAGARLDPGPSAGPAPELGVGLTAATDRATMPAEDGFARLVGEDDLTLGVILVSIVVAMFWGAVHALSPGHGKAIVAAYLVGTRGTARQAFYLGGIVTVTHTIGVFALGLVTLALSELVVPDRLYPWLNLVAALLVVAVGLAVLRSRLRGLRRSRGSRDGGRDPHGHHGQHHVHPDHGHGHDHDEHDHHGHHHHLAQPGMGWRGLLGVGISGGLLPCPSALVVLLAAISLQRVGYGLVLILAFSVGLAATITAIGLVAIGAKRIFARASFDGPVVRRLPAASALVILAFGVVMTVRAVPALT